MVPAVGQQSLVRWSAGLREPAAALFSSCSVAAGTQINVPSVFPKLCEYGICPPKGHRPTPIREDQVITALAFLAQFRPTKRGAVDSDLLARAAALWGGKVGLCNSVSNGAVIRAAIRLGLVIDEYPNCLLVYRTVLVGISKRDFKKLVGTDD